MEIFGSVGIKKLREKSEKLTAYFEYLIDQRLDGKVSLILGVYGVLNSED